MALINLIWFLIYLLCFCIGFIRARKSAKSDANASRKYAVESLYGFANIVQFQQTVSSNQKRPRTEFFHFGVQVNAKHVSSIPF